jgi:hypothetical protein
MSAARRGPLRFIILAATGQDVNRCAACEGCFAEEWLETRFDLAIWELLAASRDDDDIALTNQTIWALMEAEPEDVRCIRGLDIVAVAHALCEEARLRGLPGGWMGNAQDVKTYGWRFRSHL